MIPWTETGLDHFFNLQHVSLNEWIVDQRLACANVFEEVFYSVWEIERI